MIGNQVCPPCCVLVLRTCLIVQWVTRVTLRDVMPDASRVWSNFFKEVHLQEPTFKEAILLYRRAGSPQHHRQPDNNGSGSKANIKKQLQHVSRSPFLIMFQGSCDTLPPQ